MARSFDVAFWGWDGPHLRVYSSSGSVVTERCYDPSNWYTGGFNSTGKGVATTARKRKGEQERVNVYTVGSDNRITERVWNGDARQWTPGAFQGTGVAVAAISWVKDGHRLRVYAVDTDAKVVEHCWDGDNWYKGDFTVGNAADVDATVWTTEASPDSAFNDPSSRKDRSVSIRIYVRGTDNKVTEYYRDGGQWKPGAFSAQNIKDISVASYVKGASHVHLRAYTINNNRQLVEHCWDGDNWYTGDLSFGGVDGVAATAWSKTSSDPFGTETTHVRVYTKGADNRIAERYWDGDWHDGEFKPA